MMPQYVQTVARALPIAHAANALCDVIVHGGGLPAVALRVLVLSGFAAALAVGL